MLTDGIYTKSKKESGTWFLTLMVSALFHLVLIAGIVFVPQNAPSRVNTKPANIQVNLVSLPASKSNQKEITYTRQKNESKAAFKKPRQTEKKPRSTGKVPPKKPVSIGGKKTKTSLKKKTFRPQKVIKSAIQKIEKKVDDGRPTEVESAIAKLRMEVEKQEAFKEVEKKVEASAESSRGGKYTEELIQIYQQEIVYRIKENWVYSEELAGGRTNLETRLIIKIIKNGEIKDIWFDKKSGNTYLDDSAMKAVRKSNPLPPLPEGYDTYNVVLGFTPSGLQ